ncbi:MULTISPECIES: CHAP domain-containing protein [unclassified Enterococcus]|uniref:CHAP domain-containing protein n=1 Tax=unclassified Enterococcus TaxID=2608891 RepID=UPI001557F1E4|nr:MULTISPECIES: CHAP domain-containing protein [unclassified Enterococcus]MBS7577001.1 CHAP domain-containing protein [Enterococcus sp. MMGLQ5-2]MBS7584552.1 CHAP domain-containing protein [Enterococcus sp. MMGLQ5-1]NPD12407.1 CHAP domain-containing protein [Enterococcus sp. MMGLQ5-1]NPD36835.1 CHAP domain-containing protein [Enterococcus sp. MMGLQ5-2]
MTTRNEVLSWLNANQGRAIGFNNGSNIQCVDLVNYVSQAFFGVAGGAFSGRGIVGAKDIWTAQLDPGWQKIPVSQGSMPGDIFVTGPEPTNQYGHTGIIAEDNYQVYDENYAGRKYISKHPLTHIPYIGFVRPPYSENDNNSGKLGGKESMILFKENGRVYLWASNKYTYVGNPSELEALKGMMRQAGYDTWEHEDSKQIKYIKKLAQES